MKEINAILYRDINFFRTVDFSIGTKYFFHATFSLNIIIFSPLKANLCAITSDRHFINGIDDNNILIIINNYSILQKYGMGFMLSFVAHNNIYVSKK